VFDAATDRVPVRAGGLIVESLDDESLVYDTRNDRVHSLTPLAATVFRRCDGHSTLAEIATAASISLEDAATAVAILEERELLAPAAGHSRRETLARAAALGIGALGAAPLIRTIVAPTPAQAITGCLPDGTPRGDNCDGGDLCCNGCICLSGDGQNCQCDSL